MTLSLIWIDFIVVILSEDNDRHRVTHRGGNWPELFNSSSQFPLTDSSSWVYGSDVIREGNSYHVATGVDGDASPHPPLTLYGRCPPAFASFRVSSTISVIHVSLARITCAATTL